VKGSEAPAYQAEIQKSSGLFASFSNNNKKLHKIRPGKSEIPYFRSITLFAIIGLIVRHIVNFSPQYSRIFKNAGAVFRPFKYLL
jgi:hypothetical protein